MSWRTKILLVLALAALAAQQASGCSGIAETRPAVLPVQQGRQIVVKLHSGLGKPVKGVFLASTVEGVQLKHKDGTETTVPWESVRKITPKRNWHEFLIGVATGAVIAAIAVLSSEGDVGAAGSSAIAGLGAGAGAVAAVAGGPIEGVLYEAPKQESGADDVREGR